MKSRVEALILNILGEQEELSPPLSRIEEILYSILNDTAYIKDPLSRIEAIVLAIKEKDEYTRNALSRIEEILKAILDGTNDYDKLPQSDIERDLIRFLGEWVTKTGDIVTFSTDQVVPPFQRCEVELKPIQDLHGYDNPWPAGGGKNLCPDKKYQKSTQTTYIGQDNDTDYPFAFKTGVTYTLSYLKNGGSGGYQLYVGQQGGSAPMVGTTNPVSFTVPANGNYRLALSDGGGISISSITNVQVEVGSYATTYEPYSNICPINGRNVINVYVEETYDPQATPKATIQLGQTVYGGTVDVTEGKVTIDKAIADLTTGMTGGSAGSGYVWYKQLQNALTVPNSQIADIISEAYEPIRYNAIASNVNHVALRDNGIIYINTGSKDVLPVGNVVYALATPVEVTLTPEEIYALLGNNCVWSDAGKITVTYHS